ncbi:uncharacterized protein LOC127453790, partial [Myxocyprinus asiaticus]|uniref:uncharacterized protein LOC127453790 n=1 Tax=Myxocyprinus asiaticus TaxID=70543 RepID=UPI0022231A6C
FYCTFPSFSFNTDEKEPKTSRNNICKHFLLGKCHFGDRCRLSHSTQTEEDDRPVTEKQSKNRKNRKKMNTEKKEKHYSKIEREGLKKKPRMRIADDVISRSLWDSSVDPADFMVGHLVRFLGLLECPFSEFSWDAQVCVTDFSEELALPCHRIQYFSYKGQRVWDKDSHTDRVFGSMGQTIVPPFRGEDQQLENLTPDAGQQEETTNIEDVLNDQEQATSEFSKENRMMFHVQLQQTHMSWDIRQKTQMDPVSSIPQERWWSHPPHKPTHFICFAVDSHAALRAFQRIQRKVLYHIPQSETLWVNPATLHVTLSLLVLKGPEEVSAAAELLHTTIRNSHKPPIYVSFIPKLKHFNGTVLHVTPQHISDIQSLNTPLQEAFREKGWLHRHSRCPSYHLTLAKAQEYKTEKMFEGIGSMKLAKDINFGKLEVNTFYLCVNSSTTTESGFYQIVCVVQLPNV